MHSSNADCVFGDARLISSPITMFEHRTRLELEIAPLLVVHRDAGDIARQQVWCELNAPDRAVDDAG
jgi:hypothetical protein